MSPTLANFIFEAANFLLLAAMLGRVLFKPVRAALERERADREGSLEQGRRLRTEAEALAREARTARDAADRETADQRAEVLAAAHAEAARILEEARQTQVAERRMLLRELETTKQAQAGALAEAVGRIAGESVRRLLSALHGPALDVSLVRAACDELRALPDSAKRGAVVESARPLDPDARELLRGVLGEAFEERTVGELGAGVRVTTSAGQVDATARAVARESARAMGNAVIAEAETAGVANG